MNLDGISPETLKSMSYHTKFIFKMMLNKIFCGKNIEYLYENIQILPISYIKQQEYIEISPKQLKELELLSELLDLSSITTKKQVFRSTQYYLAEKGIHIDYDYFIEITENL